MIVVSPVVKLLGLAIDAAGAQQRRQILIAPTPLEGRLLTELLRPQALLVDADLANDPQELLLAAAKVVAATTTALGGDGPPPASFKHRIPATPESLTAWLDKLCSYERPAPDTSDALAVIRARYANSLGQKATDLGERLAAVLADPSNPAAVKAARLLAHRLRGSAGTYGFPAFGEVAAAIDDALLGGPASQRTHLQQAASQLSLWDHGPDPFAAPWPVIEVSGGHMLLGEIAAISQGQRVAVQLKPTDKACRKTIGRVVAVHTFDRLDSHSTHTKIISTTLDTTDNTAIPEDPTQERTLLIGADEVQIAATGERFARRALGDRLPALVRGWIGAQVTATTDGVAI